MYSFLAFYVYCLCVLCVCFMGLVPESNKWLIDDCVQLGGRPHIMSAVGWHLRLFILICEALKDKVNVKSCTWYRAACAGQTREKKRFTISEVAADWHEPMYLREYLDGKLARCLPCFFSLALNDGILHCDWSRQYGVCSVCIQVVRRLSLPVTR